MNIEQQSALETLKKGNESYVLEHASEFKKHLTGQNPHTAILTCADSRVPAELIFNAGIGDIFVIRVAGNIASDPSVLGSLNYAVGHLHVPLLVIMGHTNCGAVKAAEDGPGDDSSIGQIVNEIRCSFGGDDNIKQNILRQINLLDDRSQVIAQALENNELEIWGAIYHLENGKVEWI